MIFIFLSIIQGYSENQKNKINNFYPSMKSWQAALTNQI